MTTENGAPPATAPLTQSPRREKLIANYERVFAITNGRRVNLYNLTERQIEIEIENEMYRVKASSTKCGCGVTIFSILRSGHLNYDGSRHECRVKRPKQQPDPYQHALRRRR